MLTLLQIGYLLHYYYSPEEHSDCHVDKDGWRIAIDGLLELGLLRVRAVRSEYGATYEATERAMVYAEAVRAVPLPVQQWVMPTSEQRK